MFAFKKRLNLKFCTKEKESRRVKKILHSKKICFDQKQNEKNVYKPNYFSKNISVFEFLYIPIISKQYIENSVK